MMLMVLVPPMFQNSLFNHPSTPPTIMEEDKEEITEMGIEAVIREDSAFGYLQ